MKKIAKWIRIITVPPMMAFVLITALYIFNQELFTNLYEYFIAFVLLIILPLLAYPLQRKFNIMKVERRQAERRLAIILSFSGYIIGFILSIILKLHPLQKALYLTYLLSGIFIAIFSFIIKINASGHMCGFVGPVAYLVYVFGRKYAFLYFILLLIIWSSLKLKRHSLFELIIGSIIPILALYVSLHIFII